MHGPAYDWGDWGMRHRSNDWVNRSGKMEGSQGGLLIIMFLLIVFGKTGNSSTFNDSRV